MCGVVGIFHNNTDAANDIYDGLIQLQHRGQDAAGIATLEDSKMHLHKRPRVCNRNIQEKLSKSKPKW